MDSGLLRDMMGFPAERVMEPEVGAAIGAAYGEARSYATVRRAGTVELRIPSSGISSEFPQIASHADKALIAVIHEP